MARPRTHNLFGPATSADSKTARVYGSSVSSTGKHDTVKSIILALRRAGASVEEIRPFSDGGLVLVVGAHGVNLLMRVGYQVKDASIADADWRGQIATATTEEQALKLIDGSGKIVRELEY